MVKAVERSASLLPEGRLFYSVREAADAIRIGRSNMYRHVAAGHVRTHKIGVRTIISRGDLEDFIRHGRPSA